jgi:hypothetical protein
MSLAYAYLTVGLIDTGSFFTLYGSFQQVG